MHKTQVKEKAPEWSFFLFRKQFLCQPERNVHSCRKRKRIKFTERNPFPVSGRRLGGIRGKGIYFHFPNQMRENMACMDSLSMGDAVEAIFSGQCFTGIRRIAIQKRKRP